MKSAPWRKATPSSWTIALKLLADKQVDLQPETAERGAGKLVISLDEPAQRNPAIVQALVARGAQIRFVTELRHSLEDVYLSLMHNGRGQGGAQ
jgi:hypothetical protein